MQKIPIFIIFSGRKRSNWKEIKKNCCGHQLQTITYCSKYHTFDPLLYLGCQMLQTHFFLLFLGKTGQITRYLGKKTYGHQLGPMTHFLTTPKIWPTFIYRGEVPAHTFAKLPVCALINDLKKNWYRHQLQPMTHFFTNHKFDLLSYIYIINFLNLPVHALIHDLQKKTYGHQLGPMTHFLTTPKFDPLLYIGEKWLRTHLQSFLCAP